MQLAGPLSSHTDATGAQVATKPAAVSRLRLGQLLLFLGSAGSESGGAAQGRMGFSWIRQSLYWAH